MTSIEWLINELNHCLENSGFIEITPNLLDKLGKQAKEMHKQEIIDAHNQSWQTRDNPYKTAEKYYQETFKKD